MDSLAQNGDEGRGKQRKVLATRMQRLNQKYPNTTSSMKLKS